MIGTKFACLSAAAAFCLTIGIRWWGQGARWAAADVPLWQRLLVDLIVSLLLAAAIFFSVWAWDSVTIQWQGISDTDKFLLGLVALTLTLLSGIAIKVARDATQDVKDATKTVEKLHDEIERKQDIWELGQLRLLGMTRAVAEHGNAIRLNEYRDVIAWEHIRFFYEAADPEAISFSPNLLRDRLDLLANFPVAYRALVGTDRQFIVKLLERLRTDCPDVAEAARALLRKIR